METHGLGKGTFVSGWFHSGPVGRTRGVAQSEGTASMGAAFFGLWFSMGFMSKVMVAAHNAPLKLILP